MLLSGAQTALVWYYFNIIVIAIIIYMVLKLAIIRAKRAAYNQAESRSTEDKMFIRFVMFLAIFGVAYFFLREHLDQLEAYWNWLQEGIKEMKND